MKTKPMLICDVCEKPISESRGSVTVKRRWYSYGLNFWDSEIEHVCSDCWPRMKVAARALQSGGTAEGGTA